MASFQNQVKSSTSFTNQQRTGDTSKTLDEVSIPIDEMEGTIDSPKTIFVKQTKNSTTFTNQTKN